jgi:hypothetical protein
MKNSKYIVTLLLLSYWAYLSVLVLHEAYLLSNYLNKITLAVQNEKQNQTKQSLEESAKSLCMQNQNFEKHRLERRNPLLKYWAIQENTEKYANPWGISYEYLYIEWLEDGFMASEINTKIVTEIGKNPQNLTKRRRETLFLGLFLLFVYLAGEFFNFYKIEGRRKKLRLFKSLGFFGGAVLGGYLAMLLTAFIFNFVLLIASLLIPLMAFLGEKIGLMTFNLMKKN